MYVLHHICCLFTYFMLRVTCISCLLIIFFVFVLSNCHNHCQFFIVTGEQIISPGAKQGFLPLVVPLSKNNTGASILEFEILM